MERSEILLAATLTVTAVAAGCLGGSAPTATARDLVDDARDAAGERVGEPTLVSVNGLEPFRHVPPEDPGDDAEVWLHLDEDNTNGEAPGWFYEFRDGSIRYGVAVYANGEVLAESRERGVEDPVEALDGWEVDSPDVARGLADHPDWPEPRENETVGWELSMVDGEPLWRVSRSEGVFGGGRTALVHAGNGTVLAVREDPGFGPGDGGGPDREHDESRETGTVSPTDDVEARLEVEGPGRVEGILEADASQLQTGTGSVTFELLRDEEVQRSTTVEDPGPGTWNLTVENASPGEWTGRASSSDDIRDVTVVVRGNWTE